MLHLLFIYVLNILFKNETDIIFRREDVSSVAEDYTEGPICFYNVLADYFVCMPQNGKPILDLIVQLWSQSFASNIFTLLFHKWVSKLLLCYILLFYGFPLLFGYEVSLTFMSSALQLFEVQLENPETLLRYSSALVQGATNVFWYDFKLSVASYIQVGCGDQ